MNFNDQHRNCHAERSEASVCPSERPFAEFTLERSEGLRVTNYYRSCFLKLIVAQLRLHFDLLSLRLLPRPLAPDSCQSLQLLKMFWKTGDSNGETVRLKGVTTSTSMPGCDGKRAARYVTRCSSRYCNSKGRASS